MTSHLDGPNPYEVFRPSIPSPARMYDYWLGGKDHLPADREAARHIINIMPPGAVRTWAKQNRAFMQRAVRYLTAEVGIRQFIDIGAGMPTMGPVHEIAQEIAPESRVVYVDNDPIVVPHCWEMLSGVSRATIVHQDLREPDRILADPDLRELIDFDEPVAILLVAILHFISDDDDPAAIIQRLLTPFPSGSHLVLSHSTADVFPAAGKAVVDAYKQAMATAHPRTKDGVSNLLTGLDPVEPGLVWLPQWRPDPDTGLQDKPESLSCYVAVARKP